MFLDISDSERQCKFGNTPFQFRKNFPEDVCWLVSKLIKVTKLLALSYHGPGLCRRRHTNLMGEMQKVSIKSKGKNTFRAIILSFQKMKHGIR